MPPGEKLAMDCRFFTLFSELYSGGASVYLMGAEISVCSHLNTGVLPHVDAIPSSIVDAALGLA